MNDNGKKKYLVADMKNITPMPCPCGRARRAFIEPGNDTASFHIVDISENSRPHYHKKMTEIYHVLEGKGILELDDERLELKTGITVMIKPGCIHKNDTGRKFIAGAIISLQNGRPQQQHQ